MLRAFYQFLLSYFYYEGAKTWKAASDFQKNARSNYEVGLENDEKNLLLFIVNL